MVAVVGELVPDELLGLELVRGDHGRRGARRQPQRLALGVEHGRDARAVQLADQVGVEVDRHAARQAAARRRTRPAPLAR